MRALLLVALLLPALPAAAARPSLPEPPLAAGPCVVGWGFTWPGETLGARCEAAGETVAASSGTCALGEYVYVQVGNGYLLLPCDAFSSLRAQPPTQ